MGTRKFTQLCISEIKQNVIGDYNLICNGNNVAILGCTNELITLTISHIPDPMTLFPYRLTYVEIPPQRPCERLFDNASLQHIYCSCNVQERQELALEPLYISEHSLEPPKARVVHLDWAPWRLHDEKPILAILTTYGACEILSKAAESRRWQEKVCNINQYFASSFTLKKSISEIKNLNEFKECLDQFWITTFTWYSAGNIRILIVANAGGYILGFRFSDSGNEMSECFAVKTDLGRINYLKTFREFMLVGNVDGLLYLYKINLFSEKPSISVVEPLWNNIDRISCHKAEVTYAKYLDSFFLVFAKGAHIVAFRFSRNGKVLNKATCYTGAIKITGLESLSVHEFLATTIVGRVLHIRLSCTNSEELSLHVGDACTEFDVNNFQLLGLATTPNKNLWCFLLSRTKEYVHQSKYNANSAFISVCKLNSIDPLESIRKERVGAMDLYVDYLAVINLEIMNGVDLRKYDDFCEITPAKLTIRLDKTFLMELQLKLLIMRKIIHYQRLKYKAIKASTSSLYEFLLRAVQLTHIACRLVYLTNLSKHTKMSSFQELSAKCMKVKYALLQDETLEIVKDEPAFKGPVEQFINKLKTEAFMTTNSDIALRSWDGSCSICNASTDPSAMRCSNSHPLNLCIISYVQLPTICRRFCVQCNCYALDDDSALQELFSPAEDIKCTLCGFVFIRDKI